MSKREAYPRTTAQANGLATWRAKQAEERRLKLLELEHYRAYATTEVVDGREFVLVRIPDRYDFERRRGAA